MKKRLTVAVLAAALLLAGCGYTPPTDVPAKNSQGLHVNYYGTVDGCKVYDLPDLDATFVKCPNSTTVDTSVLHSTGKTTWVTHTITEASR